jgi:hypothetical protein
MRLADLLKEILRELGGEDRPVSRARVVPIAERRWRELGHSIHGDFGQVVSATIQEYSSDSAEWKKRQKSERQEDLFAMPKRGYYALRKGASADELM